MRARILTNHAGPDLASSAFRQLVSYSKTAGKLKYRLSARYGPCKQDQTEVFYADDCAANGYISDDVLLRIAARVLRKRSSIIPGLRGQRQRKKNACPAARVFVDDEQIIYRRSGLGCSFFS